MGNDNDFDPMMGGEVIHVEPAKTKSKAKKVIPIFAALVLILGIGVYFAVSKGMFQNAHDKVGVAIKNTVQPDEFGKGILEISKFSSEEYSVIGKVKTEGVSFEVDFENDTKKHNQSMSASVNLGLMKFNIKAEMDENILKLQVPELSEKVYTYNYVDKKNGAITMLLEQAQLSTERLDKILKEVNSNKSSDEMTKELGTKFGDFYKNIEVTEIAKGTFEVNGSNRSCNGYQMIIEKDDVKKLSSDISDILLKYMKEQQGSFGDIGEIEDSFGEIEDEIQNMKDLKVEVYVYHKQIAALKLKEIVDGKDLQVVFQGGDIPISNLMITVPGEEGDICRKSVKEGTLEKVTYTVKGEQVIYREYDVKTGEFSINITENDESTVFNGKVKASEDEVILAFNSQDRYDNNVTMEFTLRKKAQVEKIKGTEVNLGELGLQELSDEFNELQGAISNIYGGDY